MMNAPDLILLCGFMGTGKTTIGQELAQKLDRPFLDLDDQIVEEAGKAIPKIFEEGGEGKFRAIERRVLLDVIRNFEGIVALGGGSLQNQHLLDHLKLHGLLIFIQTPFSTILDRISRDSNRPLLLDEQGRPKSRETLEKELRVLYDERLPLYEQAVITLEAAPGENIEEQVEQLMKKIRNHVAYN